MYFKDTLVEDGNTMGTWEGEGNGLYMLHPIVDNFNCGVFPTTYHGEMISVSSDGWASWPNTGTHGHDRETKARDDTGTTPGSVNVEQAKQYCIDHAWCVGFE